MSRSAFTPCQLHDDQESNVIQVDGITCVGEPIGSPDFVTAFVKSKTAAMVDAAVMRNTMCGLQTVTAANAMEVLRCGTDTESHDPSKRFLCDKWDEAERKWHIRTVQSLTILGDSVLHPNAHQA